jgi:plasmid stabilization system protein ParE
MSEQTTDPVELIEARADERIVSGETHSYTVARMAALSEVTADERASYFFALLDAYTDKQQRQADHIAEGYEERGVSEDEAEARAWATVNKESGGGKRSGSGRGRKTSNASAKKGARKAAAKRKRSTRKTTARKSTARKSTRKSTARKGSARKRTTAGLLHHDACIINAVCIHEQARRQLEALERLRVACSAQPRLCSMQTGRLQVVTGPGMKRQGAGVQLISLGVRTERGSGLRQRQHEERRKQLKG